MYTEKPKEQFMNPLSLLVVPLWHLWRQRRWIPILALPLLVALAIVNYLSLPPFILDKLGSLFHHESQEADFWQIHPWLKAFGLVFFPRISLFFCNINWVTFVLAILFPEPVIIYLAISRGYHLKNPYSFAAYVAFFLFNWWRKSSRVTSPPSILNSNPSVSSTTTSSQPENPSSPPSLRLIPSHVLQSIQNTVENMQKQINESKSRLSLLDADPQLLSSLTRSQLSNLKEELEDRLAMVNRIAYRTAHKGRQMLSGSSSTVLISLILISDRS
jgi:hypothetical protein